ncbi:hypothetical protein ACROYT_G017578 [Oculina patagonica]
MNALVLSAFLLIALPCALGIQCYSCTISGPTSLCTSVSNSSLTNCSGIFDACVTTALTIKTKIGGLEKEAYTMTCGQKNLCSKLETENCGPDGVKKYIDKVPGVDVTKCGVACCQTPMCNKKGLVNPKPLPKPTPKSLATGTSASLLVSGISLVLGFVMSA